MDRRHPWARRKVNRPLRPLVLGAEWCTTRPGGLNRYLAGLVDAVTGPASPQVVVIGPTPPDARLHGVSSLAAGLPARVLAFRRRAARLAAGTDVVDAHFALYAFLPVMTTALRRVPLVVHFQGPWADESRIGRGEGRVLTSAKRAVERAVYRRAAVVVVLSEAFGRLVVQRYGVDPRRVEVVPPGVDLERCQPGDQSAARARFGLADNAFVAVSVRRLEARMGLDVLLDAWAAVQAKKPSAVLLLAGDGRQRADLERRRAGLPHPEGVRLLGSISDGELVALYQAADCSVVPTRALEGFGLVTLESAACGTPAIVTDVGGLPDGVSGLDATLIVPAGDQGALARRLLRAAEGDLPGRAATRAHAEKFSWDAVGRRHLEVYDRAVGQRPLRVAYIGHTAQLSGGELALLRLLPALSDVQPRVVLAEEGPLIARLRAEGIPVEVMPVAAVARDLRRDRVRPGGLPFAAVASFVWATVQLTRKLRADRPDLVHTNTLKAALYGGVAGRLAGVPVIWHLRDRIALDYLPGPAVRLVQLAARLLPVAIIANSDATLATLRFRSGGHRIYDIVVARPVPPFAGRPHLDRGPTTVGIVGRLAPWKGQDLFLRAFAQAFPGGDERARVVGSAMFGDDAWGPRLRKLAEELGIGERVEFVGFTDDVAAEYAQLDIFVHASVIPEPFGQVVLEAMASGVAVVVPDAGGPSEIVTDRVDGVLYRMGDLDALVGQLRSLAGDPGLRARLGEAARHRADDFGPDQIGSQVMDLYLKVLARHPAGADRLHIS